MGKMRSGWAFEAKHGFSGSCGGAVPVSGYMRGGPVRKAKGGSISDRATGKSFPPARVPTPEVGEKGPDLNIKMPGNHLAFAKGGPMNIHVKKGALHKRMGISKGKGIPTGKIKHDLAKAKEHHNTKEIRQDVFALNARKWHHKAKGGQVGFEHEDSEPNESQKGFTHNEPEQGEHLEARKGGKIHKAGGGIARPMGMPRAPVIGMKRNRHAPSMPGGGMGRPQPAIPGMPSQGTSSFGQQPMKPRGMAGGLGSMAGMAPMKRGGSTKC